MRVQTMSALWSIGVACVAVASLGGCESSVTSGGAADDGGGGSATTSSGGTGGSTGVAGQGTGGDLFTSTTTTIPPGSLPCGDTSCDAATEYCIEAIAGVCCGPNAYSCEALPAECQSAADCACILASACPCGPGSCGAQGIGISCDEPSGGPMVTCGYP